MNLPKLEACGNFVREARTPENLAGIAVAEIPLYAQSDASGIAAEISRRCNEYDELKARVAELEKQNAELSAKNADTDRIDELDYNMRLVLRAIVKACREYKDTTADDEWLRITIAPPRLGDIQLGDLRRLARRFDIIEAARKNGGAA